MRIGILGSGLMGAKLGTILARAGHEVVFSYARSNDKLKRLAGAAEDTEKAKCGWQTTPSTEYGSVILREAEWPNRRTRGIFVRHAVSRYFYQKTCSVIR
jgi:hypothetical protein